MRCRGKEPVIHPSEHDFNLLSINRIVIHEIERETEYSQAIAQFNSLPGCWNGELLISEGAGSQMHL